MTKNAEIKLRPVQRRAPAKALVFCIWAALGWMAPAQAQQGRIESHVTVGSTWFLDEDFPAHLTAGGSFRSYLKQRLSLEPEFLCMRASESDQDSEAAANVAYDLKAPGSRVTPYVMGGVGVLHHRGPTFSTTDFTGITGVGVRLSLTDRVFFSPRFRIGIEPNFYWLATASFGVILSEGSEGR